MVRDTLSFCFSERLVFYVSLSSPVPPDDRRRARLKASTPHKAPVPALTTKTLAPHNSKSMQYEGRSNAESTDPQSIIIIIAFKGAIQDFFTSHSKAQFKIYFTISSLRLEPSPTRTLKRPGRNRVQITCNTSSAHHVQHVVIRATRYKGTAQLLNMTEFKSYLFEFYVIG